MIIQFILDDTILIRWPCAVGKILGIDEVDIDMYGSCENNPAQFDVISECDTLKISQGYLKAKSFENINDIFLQNGKATITHHLLNISYINLNKYQLINHGQGKCLGKLFLSKGGTYIQTQKKLKFNAHNVYCSNGNVYLQDSTSGLDLFENVHSKFIIRNTDNSFNAEVKILNTLEGDLWIIGAKKPLKVQVNVGKIDGEVNIFNAHLNNSNLKAKKFQISNCIIQNSKINSETALDNKFLEHGVIVLNSYFNNNYVCDSKAHQLMNLNFLKLAEVGWNIFGR